MSVKRFFQSFSRDFDDIERLVKAFPSSLEDDVRAVVGILPFSERTLLLAHGNVRHLDYLVAEYKPLDINLLDEKVQIPCRIYLNEPMEEAVGDLTERQQVVLHCLYLRHHNGFLRQRHLEKLYGKTEAFICAFSVPLLGEYVVELLLVLEGLITPSVIPAYAQFLTANRFYWKQTQSRMVSYWNEYYRRDFPALKDYAGKRLVDRLNTAVRALEQK